MSSVAVSRLIIPVLGLGMIVSFASSYYLLGVLAEPLAAGVGATPGAVFSALSGAFLVSAVLSPFGGRWIDRRGGREVLSAAGVVWRGACFVWAGAHVVLCLPLYWAVLPDGRAGGRPPASGRVQWDGTMIRLAVLFAGAWWVATAMSAHLPRLLTRLGLSAAEAALAAGLMAGAAIAVRLIALAAPGRGSPVAAARAATLLHPFGALIAFVGGKGAAGAVALGQGAGNGLLAVASGVLPLHLFGRENYGARQALVLTPARFVQAAAPALYGVVLDRSAELALLVSSGVCLVMFAMTFDLRRKPGL